MEGDFGLKKEEVKMDKKKEFYRKIVAVLILGFILVAVMSSNVAAHEPEELTLFYSCVIDSAPAGITDSISIYWDYRTDPTIIEEKGETDLLVISWDPEILQLVDKKVEAESSGWLATIKDYVTFWTSDAVVDSVENGVLVIKIDETIATHGTVTLKFKLLKPGTTNISAVLIHSYSNGTKAVFNIGGTILENPVTNLAIVAAIDIYCCGGMLTISQIETISSILTVTGHGIGGNYNESMAGCMHQITITEGHTIDIAKIINEMVSFWNENKHELLKAFHEFFDGIFELIDELILEYEKAK